MSHKSFARFSQKILKFFLVFFVVLTLVYIPSPVNKIKKAEALATADGDGIMVYGPSGVIIPQQRLYTNLTNSFSDISATVSGTQANIMVAKTSPTKQEMIAGYINTGSTLQIMCYDGTDWTNEWSVAVGTATQRAFDIAYETNTGDVLVVYSTNTATSNELAFRTKAGSAGCGSANWSSATNYTALRTNGVVKWVQMARDPRASSNLIAITWQDGSTAPADASAAIWSGSAIQNELSAALTVSLEHTVATGDTDVIEVAVETLSGDVMVLYGLSTGANGTNGARYRTCTGGTSNCTWSGELTVPTVSDDITWLDLSANDETDEMVYAAIGNAGDDLTAAYWSGSAWTGFANVDAAAETDKAGVKPLAANFIHGGSTTRCVIQYDDSTGTGISWKHQTAPCTGAWTSPSDQSVTPSINDVRDWYESYQNPFDKSELMVMISDITPAIYAKRLKLDADGSTFTWSEPDGQASLGTVNSTPRKGFAFDYWKFVPPPPTITVDGIVYASDKTTALSAKTVHLRKNGVLVGTGSGGTGIEDTDGSGNFSFTNISAVAGDTLTLHLSAETEKANTITITDGTTSITGADLYDDHVVVQSNNGSTAINILDTLDYDNDQNATEMLFNATDTTTDTFVVEDGAALFVTSGTFTPGGNITTSPSISGTDTNVDGDLIIASSGTLSVGGSPLSIGGDYNNGGTFSCTGGQNTTFKANATGHEIEDGVSNFCSFSISGINGGWTMQSAVTVGIFQMLSGQLTIGATDFTATNASSIDSSTLILSSSTGTKTFTGDVTITGSLWNNSGNAAVGLGGSLTLTSGTFTAGSGVYTMSGTAEVITGTISIPNLTIDGTIQNDGTLTVSTALAGTGTLTNGDGSLAILNIGQSTVPLASGTLTANTSGNRVNYTGASPNCKVTTYNVLEFSGSGTVTCAVTTVNGDVDTGGTVSWTTSANLTIGASLFINSGTVNVPAFSLSVANQTVIGGTLNITSSTGAKTFGDVQLNSGGVWNNSGNAAIGLSGGLIHDGTTFTAGSGVYTMSGTAKTIFGNLTIPSLTINGTVTNNNTLTVSTALAGTGTLTNAVFAGLNIGQSTVPLASGTLTVTAANNTVNYTGASPNCKVTTYNHLTFSGSGTVTCAVDTVNGNLATSGTVSWTTGAFLDVLGNLTVGNGTTLTQGGGLGVTGNTTIGGGTSGAFVGNGDALGIAGNLILSAGSTWTKGAGTVQFNSGSSQTITDNTASKQDLGAVTTLVSSTNVSTATAIKLTSLSIGGLTTWNISDDTMTITGNGTPLTATGTFTTTGSTVIYGNSTSATVTGTTFNNLTLGIADGGNYTLPAADITLRGNLVVANLAVVTKSASNKIIFKRIAGGTSTLTGNSINSDLGILQVSSAVDGGATTLSSSSSFKATSITVDASQNLNIADDTLTITGSGTPFTFSGTTFTATGSTVDYSSASSPTIADLLYNNLTISGTIDAVTATATVGSGTFLVSGTFTPNAGTITLNGNFTNNGTINPTGTHTFSFVGSPTATITGSATATSFQNFTASGSPVGKTLNFKNNAGGSTPVFTFKGTVTLDGASGQVITINSDDDTNQWLAHFNSPATASWVSVSNSGCDAGTSDITVDANSTLGSNNGSCWKVPALTITGNAYEDEVTTALDVCDGSGQMIAVSVNGAAAVTGTCANANGAFSIDTGITPDPAAGTPIHIWVDGATACNSDNANSCGATIIRYSGSGNISNAIVRRNRVIVRSDSGSITNTNIGVLDNANDTDIPYDVDVSNNLTVEDGIKLIVASASTYSPGGTVGTSASSSAASLDGDVKIEGTVSSPALQWFVGGDFSNTGTATFSTLNFTAASTGHTIDPVDSTPYNFAGTGGGWTFSAPLSSGNLTITAGTLTTSAHALSITGDLTVNGNLSGSGAGTITVTGHVQGGGTINLTGGTLEQRIGAAKNFGTSAGANNWTFNNLTFSNSDANTGFTVTTRTEGSGTINVTGNLLIGKSGDIRGTTLDAANRTWILSGSGTPFVILSSPAGALTSNLSTFQYTGAIANVTAPSTYKHLTLGGTGTYTLPASNLNLWGNLVVTTGATVVKSAAHKIFFASSSLTHTVTGNAINSDLGIMEVNSGATLSTSSNIKATTLTLNNNTTLHYASDTVTLTGSGTPFVRIGSTSTNQSGSTIDYAGTNPTINDDTFNNLKVSGTVTGTVTASVSADFTVSGTFSPSAGTLTIAGNFINTGVVSASGTHTFSFTGGIGTKNVGAGTFQNLTFNDSDNTYTVASGTVNVGGNLNVTAGTLDFNTNDPTVSVTGATTINGTLSGTSATMTIKDNWVNNGTYTHNNGTVHANFTSLPSNTVISIAGTNTTDFYNFTATTGGVSGAKLDFKQGTTFAFANQFSASGTPSEPLTLRSTLSGTQWKHNFNLTTVSNLLVKDSACQGGLNPVLGTNVKDLGGNGLCWRFIKIGGGVDNGGSGDGGSGGGTGQTGGGQGGGGQGQGGGGQGQGGGGAGGGGGGDAP